MLTLLLSDNDCPKSNLNCSGRRPYGCLPGQRPRGGIELGRWAKLNFPPPDCLGNSGGVLFPNKADECRVNPPAKKRSSGFSPAK